MTWDEVEEGDVMVCDDIVFVIIKLEARHLGGLNVDVVDLETGNIRLWSCRDELTPDTMVLRAGQTIQEGA